MYFLYVVSRRLDSIYLDASRFQILMNLLTGTGTGDGFLTRFEVVVLAYGLWLGARTSGNADGVDNRFFCGALGFEDEEEEEALEAGCFCCFGSARCWAWRALI